jgi:hypothetical protein
MIASDEKFFTSVPLTARAFEEDFSETFFGAFTFESFLVVVLVVAMVFQLNL